MTDHSTGGSASIRIGAFPPVSRDAVVQWGVSLVTVVIVTAPVLPIFYQAFIDRPLYEAGASLTLQNFVNFATMPALPRAILNTVVYGAISTILAMVFGLAAAILLTRTDVPGRAFFANLFLVPLFLSSMVLALGWISIYGPSGYATLWLERILGFKPWDLYTVTGLSLVTGVSLAPLAFLYCVSSASLQNPNLEDAARVMGASPLRILMTVNLPLLRPAIIFSGTMVFIVAIESLALPLLLGGPVGLQFLTTLLYEYGMEQSRKDYGLVACVSLALLAIVMAMLVLQNRLLTKSQRFATVGGKAVRPRTIALGRFRWVAFAGLALYILVTLGPVFFGVTLRAFTSILTPFIPFWQVFTLRNFQMVFEYDVYFRSIWNTLKIALIGGGIGTVFVTLLSLVIQRSDFRFRRQLEFVALVPRTIPGIIFGIGAFYAVILLPFLGPLRDTFWILAIVFIMRYIPAGYGAIGPVLMQIETDLDRGSRSVGADWTATVAYILAPLIRPAVLSCFVILFVQFVKEYAAAVFLFAPGTEVIGTTILMFWGQGQVGPVAALAVIQTAITFAFVLAARFGLGVRMYG